MRKDFFNVQTTGQISIYVSYTVEFEPSTFRLQVLYCTSYMTVGFT